MKPPDGFRLGVSPFVLTLAAAATLLVAGAWPADSVRSAFSRRYCQIANEVLERTTFANGGRARLSPGPSAGTNGARSGDSVVADTTLTLSVDGYPGTLALGINLRRDAYLPLLLFVCLFVPAPVRWSYKLGGLAAGSAVVLLASAVALWMLVAWTFINQAQTVYALGSTGRAAVDFACRILLAPPANRIIGPLVLAAALTLAGLGKKGVRISPYRKPRPLLFVGFCLCSGVASPTFAQAQLAPAFVGKITVDASYVTGATNATDIAICRFQQRLGARPAGQCGTHGGFVVDGG